MNTTNTAALATILTLFAVCNVSFAQAPLNSNVAIQPNKGGLILRQRFTVTQADKTPMANTKVDMTM
jgi:hypothetical protein